MNEQNIKSNLKKMRKAKGYSQQRLADEMNIDRNTYINLENGDTHMLSKRLYDAAGILGCTLEALLEDAQAENGGNSALRDKTAEISEELVNLRDENESLRDENGKLKEKIATLEENTSLHKQLAEFSKEKAERLEKEKAELVEKIKRLEKELKKK